MKIITCWNCKQKSGIRKADRKTCPKCGSTHWRAPSLSVRLSAAWEAFWIKPHPVGERITRTATDSPLVVDEAWVAWAAAKAEATEQSTLTTE